MQEAISGYGSMPIAKGPYSIFLAVNLESGSLPEVNPGFGSMTEVIS